MRGPLDATCTWLVSGDSRCRDIRYWGNHGLLGTADDNPAAIAADPALVNMQSYSLMATNTDGHWASAGMRAILPPGFSFYQRLFLGNSNDFKPSASMIGFDPALEFDTYVSSARNQAGANPPAILGPFPEDQPPLSFGGPAGPPANDTPGLFSVSWGDPGATSGPGPGTYEIVRLTFRRGILPFAHPQSQTSTVNPDSHVFIFFSLPSMRDTRWLPDADGDWSVSGNWSGGVPGTGTMTFYYASIDVGGPAVRTITHSEGSHTIQTLLSQEHIAISGGSLMINAYGRMSSGLTMTGGILTGNDVLRVDGGLSLSGDSAIDLSRVMFSSLATTLINDYTGPSPLRDIRAKIISGYNNGSWNGTGIRSSTAATDATRAIGYAEASELFSSFPAWFEGELVDDTTVLVRLTRYGDANLDKVVNVLDFNRLATNFGSTSAFWSNGDFTYDGVVNLSDFNKLAANFGLSAGPDGPTPEDWANLAAAVPEPGGAAGLLSGLGLLCRLRRQRCC